MAESNPRPVVLPPEGVQEFRFTVVKGISPGSVVSFPGGSRTVRIGRSAENDVVIGDPAVSREHARVDLSADAWLLADAGSRTGIEKMGFRIGQEPEPLQSGDEFRLGDTILRFEVVPKRGASRLRKAGTDAEAKEAKRTPWALPGGFGRLGVGNRRRQLLLLTIIVLVLAVGWWPEPVGLPPQGTGALAIDYDEVIGFLQGRGNRLDGAYFEIPDDAEGIGIHFQVASSGEVDVRVGRERIERLTPSRQWREHQLLVLARAVSPEKGKALFVLDNRGYSAKQGDIDPASAREWGVRRMWVSRRPSLPLSLRTIDERLAVIEETASRLAAKPRDIAPIAAGLRETTLGLMKLTGQKVRLLSLVTETEKEEVAPRLRNGIGTARAALSVDRPKDALETLGSSLAVADGALAASFELLMRRVEVARKKGAVREEAILLAESLRLVRDKSDPRHRTALGKAGRLKGAALELFRQTYVRLGSG